MFLYLFANFLSSLVYNVVLMTLCKVVGSQRESAGHVKGVHDVIEVALFWLMRFAIREAHFLSKYSSPKSNGLLVPMYLLFVVIYSHPFTTPDHNK